MQALSRFIWELDLQNLPSVLYVKNMLSPKIAVTVSDRNQIKSGGVFKALVRPTFNLKNGILIKMNYCEKEYSCKVHAKLPHNNHTISRRKR